MDNATATVIIVVAVALCLVCLGVIAGAVRMAALVDRQPTAPPAPAHPDMTAEVDAIVAHVARYTCPGCGRYDLDMHVCTNGKLVAPPLPTDLLR